MLLASLSAPIVSATDAAELSRRDQRASATGAGEGKARGYEVSFLARYFQPQQGPAKLYINFDGWRQKTFTGAELANVLVAGDTADPDGDSVSNIVEFALGLDPKKSN